MPPPTGHESRVFIGYHPLVPQMLRRNAPALAISLLVVVVGGSLLWLARELDPTRLGGDLGFALVAAGFAGALTAVALTEAEHRRRRDLREAAIAQVLRASDRLCEAWLLTQLDEPRFHEQRSVTVRAFAAALDAGTDTRSWHSEPAGMRRHALVSDAAWQWRAIPSDLEAARSDYVRELGGQYLLGAAMARAVNLARDGVDAAIAAALSCNEYASELVNLEINGGLDTHKRRAEGQLDEARRSVRDALDEVLHAHDALVDAARGELGRRIAAYLPPEPARPEVARRERAQLHLRALRDIVENARTVPKDAAAIERRWLENSTLRDRLADVKLEDLLEEGFAFDEEHAANGWISFAAQPDGARSRFENLTAVAARELDAGEVELRQRIIRGLNRTAGAAGRIQSVYSARDDARRRGTSMPDDNATLAEHRKALRAAGRDVGDAIQELEDQLARQEAAAAAEA